METADELELGFKVSDTGIGIAVEMQRDIFQPFFQADSSTRKKYSGTGLGLSVVLQLVEKMQGTIGFTSEPAVGTTFYFTVVLKKSIE